MLTPRTVPRFSLTLTTLLLGACTGADKGGEDEFDCQVAVIGGGAGGLHTAFRLAPTYGAGVCLFEKEAFLGGRIKDVSINDDPDLPRVGVGARRVMESQEVLFNLASELGITLETPTLSAELISARGGFAFSKEDLLPLYPGVTPSGDGDTETALYDELRFGGERANAASYGTFPDYVKGVVGEESYQFLHDMTRFRADFTYDLDPNSYLDWLDEEWDVCCTASYPVGGMSAFILGMQAAAEASGAQIFLSDPVSSIDRAEVGYVITSANRTVTAEKVVIAVPPTGLEWIDGDVLDEIKAQPIYQDIVPVRVTTITQWWSEPWYADIINPDAAEDNVVWRAWTTEHCLNSIEIPQEPYAAAANVTRSVYNDDLDCALFWEDLAAMGTEAVEAEVKIGLEYLFSGNGVSSPATVTVPDPLDTYVQVWPDAWHWLGAGTDYSNAELFDWAIDPLDGEDVALVGEAYNVQRSGWSDGAYKSSIHLLNARYGMDLAGR